MFNVESFHDKQPDEDYEFDFAISFAGAQRTIARELAKTLSDMGTIVFYDSTYKARLLGKRLDREFEWIFGPGTSFFVPLVSSEYVDSHWPQLEWSVAREEASRRRYEFILPLRVDDSRLLGLPDTIGYLDLRNHNIEEAARILVKKLDDWRGILAYAPIVPTWVAIFGLEFEEVLQSAELPKSVPKDYPSLCDWLEEDLLRRISIPEVENPRYLEPSQRTGETLSVQVVFEWWTTAVPLSFGDLSWWHLLDLTMLKE